VQEKTVAEYIRWNAEHDVPRGKVGDAMIAALTKKEGNNGKR
jgi:hypothetical protein